MSATDFCLAPFSTARRDPDDRLLAIVAGTRHADPDLTLAAIATRLEQMRERTPRGNTK